MRLLGCIVAACLALAVLRMVAVVLALALITAAVWGIIFRPLQTIGFIVSLTLLSAFERHPLAGLGLLGVALICTRGQRAGGSS